jgi:hypothetical protein
MKITRILLILALTILVSGVLAACNRSADLGASTPATAPAVIAKKPTAGTVAKATQPAQKPAATQAGQKPEATQPPAQKPLATLAGQTTGQEPPAEPTKPAQPVGEQSGGGKTEPGATPAGGPPVSEQSGGGKTEPGKTEAGVTPEAGGGKTEPKQTGGGQANLPVVQSSGNGAGMAASVAQAAARPTSYTLKAQEYPYCIARRFNIDPVSLIQHNGLWSWWTSYAGQKLSIPAWLPEWKGSRALTAHPASYTVRVGQNIYGVACVFGDVTPQAIAAANGLVAPYKLTVGQVLTIP